MLQFIIVLVDAVLTLMILGALGAPWWACILLLPICGGFFYFILSGLILGIWFQIKK